MSTSTNPRRRVVITGVGIISPIGIGMEPFWQSINAMKSGISRIERLSATAVPGNVAGEVKDFTEETAKKEYLKAQRKSLKVMCREIQIGVASANLAIIDAGLNLESLDHDRIGIEFGANQMFSPPTTLQDPCFAASPSGPFEFSQWGPQGLFKMEPLWLLKYLPNMPACHIGIHADARGPNNSLTMAEASGNSALGEALRILERDRADLMLAGTCGVRIHAVKCLHAALWNKLADYQDAEPSTWSRPFDATRNGEVVGEGGCSFILEEENYARARGARVLGSLLGAGSSCAIERNGRPNYQRAIVNAVRAALRQAEISASDVGHVNAHGLGHPEIDVAEAAAIREVFGPDIPVTAPKSFLANSGAACGMLELATSLIALNHGVIPATLNYSNPDPTCPLNIVTGAPKATNNKIVININVTGQAQAAAAVVSAA